MNYYLIDKPYFSLISADNLSKAKSIYNHSVYDKSSDISIREIYKNEVITLLKSAHNSSDEKVRNSLLLNNSVLLLDTRII